MDTGHRHYVAFLIFLLDIILQVPLIRLHHAWFGNHMVSSTLIFQARTNHANKRSVQPCAIRLPVFVSHSKVIPPFLITLPNSAKLNVASRLPLHPPHTRREFRLPVLRFRFLLGVSQRLSLMR